MPPQIGLPSLSPSIRPQPQHSFEQPNQPFLRPVGISAPQQDLVAVHQSPVQGVSLGQQTSSAAPCPACILEFIPQPKRHPTPQGARSTTKLGDKHQGLAHDGPERRRRDLQRLQALQVPSPLPTRLQEHQLGAQGAGSACSRLDDSTAGQTPGLLVQEVGLDQKAPRVLVRQTGVHWPPRGRKVGTTGRRHTKVPVASRLRPLGP